MNRFDLKMLQQGSASNIKPNLRVTKSLRYCHFKVWEKACRKQMQTFADLCVKSRMHFRTESWCLLVYALKSQPVYPTLPPFFAFKSSQDISMTWQVSRSWQFRGMSRILSATFDTTINVNGAKSEQRCKQVGNCIGMISANG